MIFPRSTALEATASIEAALKPVVDKMAPSGDLRMERSTLERIEFVIECAETEPVVKAMAEHGWRRLRVGRGPMVFAREGFPKAVICVAKKAKHDLLGVAKAGNFEVLLFLRTGTTIFKRDMMAFIQASGRIMRPDRGLFQGDQLLAWTEEDIFTALGLDFIPPNERYAFDPEKRPVAVNF